MSGIVTLIGNPRAGSRTHRAALEATEAVARRLGLRNPGETVDLAVLAGEIHAADPSSDLDAALKIVASADVLVVASPTYKGTYTGLLKAFLDLLPSGALRSATALPLLLMGDPRHALAVEVHLRPLLVELGARVPTPGLALLESDLPRLNDVLDRWADRTAPQVEVAA
ncbi:NADPH-dependent FMN reductase [Thermomonospora umbrina]|uniref:FMN reductase n=1 Tax=Thermomonospora umbrina TaxID=111806 RepID=A0A3D9SW11_9ACTN|nr:NAD(P)H-dependent oxidoreductase [Thermomonospora umbrina]REE96764.1 FMN reductase [Thermomonospora umbrina]